MKALLLGLLSIAIGVVGMIFRGFVALKLYTWFVVTNFASSYELPALTITHMIGFSFIYSIFNASLSRADIVALDLEDKSQKDINQFAALLTNSILLPLFLLIGAAIFRAVAY